MAVWMAKGSEEDEQSPPPEKGCGGRVDGPCLRSAAQGLRLLALPTLTGSPGVTDLTRGNPRQSCHQSPGGFTSGRSEPRGAVPAWPT